jgi:hypothetical protein
MAMSRPYSGSGVQGGGHAVDTTVHASRLAAAAGGQPAGRRRATDRLLEDIPTRAGFDRNEYPPAVGRGRGPGLERGTNPRGWKADVRYVPSAENRSHGSSLGAKLLAFCNGTRFHYVFR